VLSSRRLTASPEGMREWGPVDEVRCNAAIMCMPFAAPGNMWGNDQDRARRPSAAIRSRQVRQDVQAICEPKMIAIKPRGPRVEALVFRPFAMAATLRRRLNEAS
jgi:hypothetical protein